MTDIDALAAKMKEAADKVMSIMPGHGVMLNAANVLDVLADREALKAERDRGLQFIADAKFSEDRHRAAIAEFNERQGVVEIRRLAAILSKAEKTLRDLLERIYLNGGLGEYRGGQPFIIASARAVLSELQSAVPSEYAERVVRSPAECVSSCDVSDCPYSHMDSWELWKGPQYSRGPFRCEADAIAAIEPPRYLNNAEGL